MPLFRSLAIILLFGFASSAATAQLNAQGVTIIEAPSNFEFVDMGYDATTNEVGIVGHIVNGADRTATVFELNAASNGFTTQTLADLPGATSNAEVNGISSDASRIAGTSSSTDSVDIEGTTWLRSNPNIPTGIGFTNGFINNSSAIGAWANGVIGDSSGLQNAITWNTVDGIQILPGTEGGIAQAQGVNANGEISVGFSTHEVFDGAAYYWDNSGINRLDDIVVGFSTFQSSASSISPDGNFIGGDLVLIDSQNNFLSVPVVWEGADRTLRVLTDSNGDLIQGTVLDVSNLGFAVGTFVSADFIDSFGFIWSPDFINTDSNGGVQIFEDWLEEIDPNNNLGSGSLAVNSIAEANGRLLFTVLTQDLSYSFVDVVIEFEAGDVNRDGSVNFLDISPFISVLSTGDFQAEADVDRSGGVNFLDIAPFIQVLSSN